MLIKNKNLDFINEDENGYDKKTEDEMFSLLIKYLIIPIKHIFLIER